MEEEVETFLVGSVQKEMKHQKRESNPDLNLLPLLKKIIEEEERDDSHLTPMSKI